MNEEKAWRKAARASAGICVSCGRNAACEGDTRCVPCGGRFHCSDPTCKAPGCENSTKESGVKLQEESNLVFAAEGQTIWEVKKDEIGRFVVSARRGEILFDVAWFVRRGDANQFVQMSAVGVFGGEGRAWR